MSFLMQVGEDQLEALLGRATEFEACMAQICSATKLRSMVLLEAVTESR
jgi:hypothetical protein